jgi:hypothetical protein
MSDRGPFVWQMVKEAIEHLDREVSNADIRDYILNRYGSVNQRTIYAHITLQAVNARSRVHYPENQRPRVANDPRYDVLFRVGHGRYVRYDPRRHGTWEIRADEGGKLQVVQTAEDQEPNYETLPEPVRTVTPAAPPPVAQIYDWARLNHLQIGRYAEYFTKMAFTLYGFEVYTSEVDDRGIDFVARRDRGPFYVVQVKSIRGLNYIFFPKSKFERGSYPCTALRCVTSAT